MALDPNSRRAAARVASSRPEELRPAPLRWAQPPLRRELRSVALHPSSRTPSAAAPPARPWSPFSCAATLIHL